MTHARPDPPDRIAAAARARTEARARRDWAQADALRAEIEAAGWRVIDDGTGSRLEPAAPPTLEVAGVMRYGSADAVPSALDAPATAAFTVELVAEDGPATLTRVLAGLRSQAPEGTHVVIVANDPGAAQAERLVPGSADLAPIAGEVPEVVWTSERLGHAAARNVGLRRAHGEIVILADGSMVPTGDALTPLAYALTDPTVAVAGAVGLTTADLRRFLEADGPEVDAITLGWLAFRRSELDGAGLLDERFVLDRLLGAWWSLVLRAGPDEEVAPRRALRLGVPLARLDGSAPAESGGSDSDESDTDRLVKRARYRILDRFRGRPDLCSGVR
jgi:hypothetical protein